MDPKDLLNGATKIIIWGPIVLTIFSISYVFLTGANEYMSTGSFPEKWRAFFDIIKGMLGYIVEIIKWGCLGIYNILKIVFHRAWLPVNRFSSILILVGIILVTITAVLTFKDFAILQDYSNIIIPTISICTALFIFFLFFRHLKQKGNNFPEDWGDKTPGEQRTYFYRESGKNLKWLIGVTIILGLLGLTTWFSLHSELFAFSAMTLLSYGSLIALLFLAYIYLKKTKFWKSKGIRLLINLIFIIPCIFLESVEFIFKELKHTPTIVYQILLIEILLISMMVIWPFLKDEFFTKGPISNAEEIRNLENQKLDYEKIKGLNQRKIDRIIKENDKFPNQIPLELWNKIINEGLYSSDREEELKAELIEFGILSEFNKEYNMNIKSCEDINKFLGTGQQKYNKCTNSLNVYINYIRKQAPYIIKIRQDNSEMDLAKEKIEEKLKFLKKSSQKGVILLREPVYLNKRQSLGNFENLQEGVPNNVYNYNYSISFWIFLHSLPPNYYQKGKLSVLDYGGKPTIYYNPHKNKLMVEMNDGRKYIKKVIYEEKKFPLQKWMNIVINYDGGIFDIFVNGKLRSSHPGIIPYMSTDAVTIGSKNLRGGIGNIVYMPSSLSKLRIETNYQLLKNKNPPII